MVILRVTTEVMEKGEDITHNIRTIKSLPMTLSGDDFPKYLEIRGSFHDNLGV